MPTHCPISRWGQCIRLDISAGVGACTLIFLQALLAVSSSNNHAKHIGLVIMQLRHTVSMPAVSISPVNNLV